MRRIQSSHVAQMEIFVFLTISAHIPLIVMSVGVDTIPPAAQMGRLWKRAQARRAQIDVVSDI